MRVDDVLVNTTACAQVVVLCGGLCCEGNVSPEVTHQEVPVGTEAVGLAVQLLHVLVAALVHRAVLNTLNTLVGKVDSLERVVPAILDV